MFGSRKTVLFVLQNNSKVHAAKFLTEEQRANLGLSVKVMEAKLKWREDKPGFLVNNVIAQVHVVLVAP